MLASTTLLLWLTHTPRPAMAQPASKQLWAALADPSGWTEVSRSEEPGVGEVVVRHKDVAGQPCLEGTTRAKLDPDALLAASSDIPTQPKWSTWTLPYSAILERQGEAFVYAQVLDNPYPVADRAWFLRGEAVRQGSERVFRWDRVDPAGYPQARAAIEAVSSGAVVTQVNLGDWTFSPQPDGDTRIRYRICTDAGGSIPRWAGEYAATKTLPTNLGDIVREVKRRTR